MRPTISIRNKLIRALDHEDVERLLPHVEPVRLERRELIEEAGVPIESVYFVEDGVVSVVAQTAGSKPTEIGLVGREGMTGISIVLGDDRSANQSFVQVAGSALRIGSDNLRHLFVRNPNIHALALRYVQTFLIQTSQTALANGKSRIEERLARWLLMVHDRDGGRHVEITHEFLAVMIGTRRPGVTIALHDLEGRGLIRSRRGKITIIDREGLEEHAGGFYGLAEAEYRRIIGSKSAD